MTKKVAITTAALLSFGAGGVACFLTSLCVEFNTLYATRFTLEFPILTKIFDTIFIDAF